MPRGRQRQGQGAAAPTIAERMIEVEHRLDSLDNAIREVHPEYAGPIVRRCEELEATVRDHANRTMEILRTYDGRVHAMGRQVTRDAEDAILRLKMAADRHQSEGAILRKEWGGIKEDVDARSLQIEQDMAQMQDLSLKIDEDMDKMTGMLASAMQHLDRQDALVRAGDMQIARLAKLESLAAEVRRVCVRIFRVVHMWIVTRLGAYR